MKTTCNILIFATALFVLAGCCKDPDEAVLPDKVELGETVVYLNGKLAAYEPIFDEVKIHDLLNFSFLETLDQGQTLNNLTFAWLPIKDGQFKLVTDDKPRTNAQTAFNQTIDEDEKGYEYELEDASEGYFKIELLDREKLEVKGSFKVKFCRKSKNGHDDLGLPKTLLFQGVFYENYTVK